MVNPPQCERNRQELRKNLNRERTIRKKAQELGAGRGVFGPTELLLYGFFRGSGCALTGLSAGSILALYPSGVIAQMTEKFKGLREPVVEAKGGR